MLKVLILTLALWQSLAAEELSDEHENDDLEFPNFNDTELEDGDERTYRFMPFQLEDKVYAVNIFTKANWFTAQKICSYQGMNLASFSTPQENEQLRRYLLNNGFTNAYEQTYWVSGTDLGSQDQWYWMSSGLPVTYSNWLPGEPNNSGGNEHCIQIKTDSKWNDIDCDTELYFICENRCQLDSYSVPLYPSK